MRFVEARIDMGRAGTALPFWRPQPYCVLKGSVLVTTVAPVTSGNKHRGPIGICIFFSIAVKILSEP